MEADCRGIYFVGYLKGHRGNAPVRTLEGVVYATRALPGAAPGELAFMGDPRSGLPCSTGEVMDLRITFLRRPTSGRGDQ